MTTVQVDISDTDIPPAQGRQGDGGSGGGSKGQRASASSSTSSSYGASSSGTQAGPDIDMEREVTKRQIIQSVTTVVVVILYMVFTLLRDRDSGVVVVDPDDGADDWQE